MNSRSVPQLLPLVDDKKEMVGGNASASAGSAAATPIVPSGRERGRRRIATSDTNGDDPPASSSAPLLLALPVDSLHCIASFLCPGEWSNLGQAGRGASHACREVVRRVRMHGFRCATEIVTAWARGEHSDARELAALYVSSGVPVYPLYLQHSYVTLAWRMSVEASEMESAASTTGDDGAVTSSAASATSASAAADTTTDATPKPAVDRFYSDRNMARESDGFYRPGLTFLEEKCLFWQQRAAEEEDSDDDGGMHNLSLGRRHSLTSSVSLRPPREGRTGNGQRRQLSPAHLPPRRSLSSSNLPSLSPRSQAWASMRNKTSYSVRVHRHLADRHVLGRPAVNDDDGKMRAAPLSLAADFFHPHFSPLSLHPAASSSSAFPAVIHPTDSKPPTHFASSDSVSTDGPWEAGGDTENDDSMLHTLEQVHQEPVREAAPAAAATASGHSEPSSEMHLPLTSPFSNIRVEEDMMEGDVALEVYSAASLGVSKERHSSSFNETGAPPPQSHSSKDLSLLSLRSRIAFYQRKLDSHLTHYQSSAFDECLLDFWDEFMPSTAGVHFHDGHTPVPRMSSLHTFLSRPCPKSFGIVQCEIERIKTATTKKGVKGRLFPAYQYRLFIRDRREDRKARNDTVLMIAKNKGKSTFGISGDSPLVSSSKRGGNNYFLHTPQNRDVTGHFESANESLTNGAAKPIQSLPSSTPREVGRLQSNFIGTDFQIFAPTTPRRKMQSSSRGISRDSSFDSSYCDDDDVMSTSSQEVSEGLNLSAMTTSSNEGGRKRSSMVEKWKSRRRTSSCRRSGLGEPDDGYISSSSSIGQRSRRGSWPSLRSYSKRAIANLVVDADARPPAQDMTPQKTRAEEENGVITYTANLLGNRPRIMDVCIPRVSEEGVVSSVWKRHVDASADMGDEETMMSIFKQLQPHLQPGNNNNAPGNDTTGKTPREFGLMALQNRPPWWNADLGAFVLNFGGRVSVASVKNFQLCDRGNQEAILLQFGRVDGRHSFTMDFQYPLSAVQAFSVAISSLQSKISFG